MRNDVGRFDERREIKFAVDDDAEADGRAVAVCCCIYSPAMTTTTTIDEPQTSPNVRNSCTNVVVVAGRHPTDCTLVTRFSGGHNDQPNSQQSLGVGGWSDKIGCFLPMELGCLLSGAVRRCAVLLCCQLYMRCHHRWHLLLQQNFTVVFSNDRPHPGSPVLAVTVNDRRVTD